MNLVFLGPPGAGKGTQAKVMSEQLNIPHISTGEMLRSALKKGTPVGLKAKKFVESGELVPDDVVTEIIKERLDAGDTEKGFILDGFPRTRTQAGHLAQALRQLNKRLNAVIYFKTSPQVSIERLNGRRVCSRCGANFHVKNMPSTKEDICDYCGGRLIQREDDRPKTVKKRLKVYEQNTSELIHYYKTQGLLKAADANKEVNELNKYIHSEILPVLSGDNG